MNTSQPNPGKTMNHQKLLGFKLAEGASETHHSEPLRRVSVTHVSADNLKPFVPSSLDLAGNRWSPLHEW